METQVGAYTAAPEKVVLKSGAGDATPATMAAKAKVAMSLLKISPVKKPEGAGATVPEGADLTARTQLVHDHLDQILAAWFDFFDKEEKSAYLQLRKTIWGRMVELWHRKLYLKKLIGGEITADDEEKEDEPDAKPDKEELPQPGSLKHTMDLYEERANHYRTELSAFAESGIFTHTRDWWDTIIEMFDREAAAIKTAIDGNPALLAKAKAANAASQLLAKDSKTLK